MKIKVEARQAIKDFLYIFSEFRSQKLLPRLSGLEFKHVI